MRRKETYRRRAERVMSQFSVLQGAASDYAAAQAGTNVYQRRATLETLADRALAYAAAVRTLARGGR